MGGRATKDGRGGGYDLKQREKCGVSAPAGGMHPIAPAILPYGGLGLNRVRNEIGPLTPSQVMAPAVSHAQGWLARILTMLKQGIAWWRVVIRRSRAVEYGTAILIIVLLVVLVLALKPKPKPATPWQKFRRSFGL